MSLTFHSHTAGIISHGFLLGPPSRKHVPTSTLSRTWLLVVHHHDAQHWTINVQHYLVTKKAKWMLGS